MQTFKSIFPFNQKVIAEYPLMDSGTIDGKLAQAEKAFASWKNFSFTQRGDVLKRVANILRNDKEKLGTLMTYEMGKVIAESKAEAEKCGWACDYFAEHAESLLQDDVTDAGYFKSFVTYQPVGAVFAVMPWNFPFWQVFRYAVPTLMAGNVTLLKHAPNVTGCSLAIEKMFLEAGAPEGVFQSLVMDIPDVEKVVASNTVQGVTLTGSERAGSSLASLAGKHIKKSVMELGGSDPLIILPDADMKKAAAVAVQSRMLNAGQSCISAKRFIVLQSALDDFVSEVSVQIKKLQQGDPFEDGITIGPMARLDLADALEKQLNHSLQKGALLHLGGHVNGCNFQPTLLLNVLEGMPAFDEEMFGPVASIITAKNEEDAITIANESRYGLGGSVWTKDVEKGIAVAKKITAGAVFINSLVKSDPRLPFGGVKKSGYGRELGKLGIHEFVNAKIIAVEE